MNYYQVQPQKKLRNFVRCYWVLENTGAKVLHYTILPDGFFDILICYHQNKLDTIMLTGLWTERVDVVIHPETKIMGVQFRLPAVEQIFQQSIAPFLNQLQELEKTYWGLANFTGKSDSALFEFLNGHLWSLIEASKHPDSRKQDLLRLVNRTKGNETVDYYSRQTSWSARQINRYFQSTFGLSLKRYCTIRKGASSFAQIKRGQLYPDQNYFDQPHFIKEIKRITGTTPKELTKNKNDRFLQFSIIPSK